MGSLWHSYSLPTASPVPSLYTSPLYVRVVYTRANDLPRPPRDPPTPRYFKVRKLQIRFGRSSVPYPAGGAYDTPRVFVTLCVCVSVSVRIIKTKRLGLSTPKSVYNNLMLDGSEQQHARVTTKIGPNNINHVRKLALVREL